MNIIEHDPNNQKAVTIRLFVDQEGELVLMEPLDYATVRSSYLATLEQIDEWIEVRPIFRSSPYKPPGLGGKFLDVLNHILGIIAISLFTIILIGFFAAWLSSI